MNKENLKKYIQMIHPISDEKAFGLTKGFEYFSFSKNEYLIVANKVNKYSYFLENGYVHSYALNDLGNEVTTGIYSAPCYVNDFISFFKQQPVRENFQALTECNGWAMTYDSIKIEFHNSPEFREYGRLLVLHNFELLKERMLEMVIDTAENRYLKLLTRHPDIFQNVPLKIIASYLGITDTSLSRIRRKVFQKRFLAI